MGQRASMGYSSIRGRCFSRLTHPVSFSHTISLLPTQCHLKVHLLVVSVHPSYMWHNLAGSGMEVCLPPLFLKLLQHKVLATQHSTPTPIRSKPQLGVVVLSLFVGVALGFWGKHIFGEDRKSSVSPFLSYRQWNLPIL